MAALRLGSIVLLLGACATACGGSTGSGPVRVAPAETGATAVVAAAAVTGTTSPRAARPTFPATKATDVIALAELHPAGTVIYDVSEPSVDGTETIRISRLGATGAIEWTRPTGSSWIGFANSKIVYACSSTSTDDPVCHRGDPGGAGAKAAYGVAKLLGASAVRTTFSPFVGIGRKLGVAPDEQLDLAVSCMATSADNGDYRLCATKDGQITQLSAGAVRILATSVAPAVPKDVAAPTQVE